MGNARPPVGRPGMGWRPDYPDHRDYTMAQKTAPRRARKAGADAPVEDPEKVRADASIKEMMDVLGLTGKKAATLPKEYIITDYCSPIQDQGELGSCTAQAGVSMLEYCEKRAFGHHIDASRCFLYKATRNLMQETGDTGAYLRTTMGALALFGTPPEKYWPYNIDDFDVEPPAFCYSFGQQYQALQYFRLDDPSMTDPEKLIRRIKLFTKAWLPSIFGFSVFNSIWSTGADGNIPFPGSTDSWIGGHAVMVVGYNDDRVMPISDGSGTVKGAFMVQNSWGTGFGAGGYNWLPYEYVRYGLVDDFWALISSEWVNTKKFGI